MPSRPLQSVASPSHSVSLFRRAYRADLIRVSFHLVVASLRRLERLRENTCPSCVTFMRPDLRAVNGDLSHMITLRETLRKDVPGINNKLSRDVVINESDAITQLSLHLQGGHFHLQPRFSRD